MVASIGISQMPNNRIMERINVAQKISTLSRQNNGNTSLGARFLKCGKVRLQWQKEKPLFGWGIQGATEKRKQETKEKNCHWQHWTIYPCP